MRRTKGEGSFYTETVSTGETKVVYQTYIRVDGKRIKIRGYGATRPEATRNHQRNLQKRLKNGFTTTRSTWTISEALKEWLDVDKRGAIGDTTRKNHRRNIERHIIGNIGNPRIDQINTEALSKALNETIPSKAGPSAAAHTKAALNALLNNAIARGKLESNPLATIKTRKREPEVQDEDRKYYARRKGILKSMVKWAEQTNDEDLLLLYLLRLGLRKGEILGLEWNCVTQLTNANKASLVIKQQLAYENGKTTIVHRTKNGRTRTVPLDEATRKALLARKKEARKAQNPEFKDLVLLKANGRPPSVSGFATNWRKLQDRFYDARPPRNGERTYWRPHYNRHIAASELQARGASLNTTAELLGHQDLATTSDTYTKTDSEQRRKAIQQLVE